MTHNSNHPFWRQWMICRESLHFILTHIHAFSLGLKLLLLFLFLLSLSHPNLNILYLFSWEIFVFPADTQLHPQRVGISHEGKWDLFMTFLVRLLFHLFFYSLFSHFVLIMSPSDLYVHILSHSFEMLWMNEMKSNGLERKELKRKTFPVEKELYRHHEMHLLMSCTLLL